jgi:hypothetical protein
MGWMAGLCGMASPAWLSGKIYIEKLLGIREAHHFTAETHPHA